MLMHLRRALLMTLALTVITGICYPLAVTGLAQVLFRNQADGSLLTKNGAIVGSRLIGQNFAKPEYFHPRQSAAGSAGYDPQASGGSNLGPTNPDLAKRLQKDGAAYRAENHVTGALPADAITASASGLDPDISPANALLQADRVASARGASLESVRELVRNQTKQREFGFLGEPRVNVLALNMAIDERFPAHR